MSWRLRDQLHWCDCGGRAVFLDLEADRYFCLPGKVNAAFLRIAANRCERGDLERLATLVRQGLLVEDETCSALQPPARIEEPQGDFPRSPAARAPLHQIVRAIVAELWTARSLRRHGLGGLIERVRQTRPMHRIGPGDRHRSIEALVKAAGVAALLLRSHDRCLVRGLAYHCLCRRRGVDTKLVLGVIAHPFTAHCWVQLDNIVLVGGHEQARLYTPILVVE